MPGDELRTFFDTNVLLYLISDDIPKSRRLDEHLERGGIVSVQVLNEFTNAARRKFNREISEIRPFLEALQDTLEVVPVTLDTHRRGLDLITRHRFSTYDAMIVAAALGSQCSVLLSEDMHNGLQIDGKLTIRNPFRA